MRTTKTISISLPPKQLKAAERIARKENRTMSELVREALRRYEANAPAPTSGNTELLAALKAIQEDARRAGLDRMTMREINAEIAASRGEHYARKAVKRPA
jgi:Arc/MetJ-type ribon-helix-helix transcriptional regulator